MWGQTNNTSLWGMTMTLKLFCTLCLIAVSSVSTGCIKTQAYFTPPLVKIADSELPKWSEPKVVDVEVEYWLNGDPDARFARKTRSAIVRAMERTTLFKVKSGSEDKFVLKMVDTYDQKELHEKVKLVASSWGATGSSIQDNLVWDVRLVRDNKTKYTRSGRQTINVVIGKREVPESFGLRACLTG